MAFLRKSEVLTILGILIFIFLTNFFNFKISERKARDNQRNLDVSAIAEGIELYKIDYGYYPRSSSDGRITACKGPDTKIETDKYGNWVYAAKNKPKLINLAPCQWGQDALMDITDVNYPHYLRLIPKDSQESQGASYRYVSDGEKFQILGAFEGKNLKEYDKRILKRGIACGIRICNFGKDSSNTPLEKSL